MRIREDERVESAWRAVMVRGNGPDVVALDQMQCLLEALVALRELLARGYVSSAQHHAAH